MRASLKKLFLLQEFSLLLAFISVRRKQDLLTQSLCLLAFKSTESGNICLHTMPALCKSHFQVICLGALFQSMFGLSFFSLWGLRVKKLSKYAHESLWKKAAQQVVQMHYRNCNGRCRRKEPELGSSSQERAEPRSIATSVSE